MKSEKKYCFVDLAIMNNLLAAAHQLADAIDEILSRTQVEPETFDELDPIFDGCSEALAGLQEKIKPPSSAPDSF